MKPISIAVHGGAGEDPTHIRENERGFKEGLQAAINAGYKVLEKGGSALDAVQEAAKSLEDNQLFNAGRGAALNNKGEIEMDASIMDGKTLKAGAVAMVKNVRNPIVLARLILEKTNHILISDSGALELARDSNLALEPDSYFVTDYQMGEFLQKRDQEFVQQLLEKRVHGTIGAVALDNKGNIAAATSTGGTCNALAGRIGDSCLIGAGCYAHNASCAISGTGDGEFLISGVIAHTIAMVMELTQCSLQEACDTVIHVRNKGIKGTLGVIGVDTAGNFGIAFNGEQMHRAWQSTNQPLQIHVYG
jgi:beta-aspartyl-peptidase (threonine type)